QGGRAAGETAGAAGDRVRGAGDRPDAAEHVERGAAGAAGGEGEQPDPPGAAVAARGHDGSVAIRGGRPLRQRGLPPCYLYRRPGERTSRGSCSEERFKRFQGEMPRAAEEPGPALLDQLACAHDRYALLVGPNGEVVVRLAQLQDDPTRLVLDKAQD